MLTLHHFFFQELDCRLVAYFGDKAIIDGLGLWLPQFRILMKTERNWLEQVLNLSFLLLVGFFFKLIKT